MKKRPSNKELDVLQALWRAKKPLTASGIVRDNPELSINTVQVVLKHLTSNKLIKVADIVYSGTVLSRAYEPVLTKGRYVIDYILENPGIDTILFSEAVNSESDLKVIEECERLLKERRQQLAQ